MPVQPPSVPARDRAIARRLATGLARRGVQFRAGEFALLEGASGSVAVLAMILWAQASHRPADIWGAYAAFWACLADNRLHAASRLRAIALFVIGGAVLATAMTAMVHPALPLTDTLAAVAVAAITFVAGRSYGMATVGMLLGVVVVVAAEWPVDAAGPMAVGIAFLAGGGLALLLRIGSIHVLERPNRDRDAARPAPPELPSTRSALLHAASAGVAVFACFLAAHGLGLAYPQWATMTAVVVITVNIRTSSWRAVERIAGTLIGTAIVMVLIGHANGRVALEALVLPLAALTIALRAVNYTIFVGCVTPLFVVIAKIALPLQSAGAPQARAVDTIVGTSIALVICTLIAGLVRWIDTRRSPAPSARR
ncbi:MULTISPECIES: FUSC family protein [unclassified Sphingomonas]|uniref:FUSC family protein n=1 Tax=unclassified Sphingomonas TaxID=196159 RepID=UPI0028554F6E|nr:MULTISPECIES: FUSC family protein [unclassified Sphingomonas]MDR6113051.1 putative membrane protein YccC [Sphingomonas sp. SORGH_AS_0789]MDR6149586.1 putative membrane protein YccC [Sphingomonas sp. SORGH_AS_0742]